MEAQIQKLKDTLEQEKQKSKAVVQEKKELER